MLIAQKAEWQKYYKNVYIKLMFFYKLKKTYLTMTSQLYVTPSNWEVRQPE